MFPAKNNMLKNNTLANNKTAGKWLSGVIREDFPKNVFYQWTNSVPAGVCVCVGGEVKVNFLAHFGQKSDLSGLSGIGYWVWSISTM